MLNDLNYLEKKILQKVAFHIIDSAIEIENKLDRQGFFALKKIRTDLKLIAKDEAEDEYIDRFYSEDLKEKIFNFTPSRQAEFDLKKYTSEYMNELRAKARTTGNSPYILKTLEKIRSQQDENFHNSFIEKIFSYRELEFNSNQEIIKETFNRGNITNKEEFIHIAEEKFSFSLDKKRSTKEILLFAKGPPTEKYQLFLYFKSLLLSSSSDFQLVLLNNKIKNKITGNYPPCEKIEINLSWLFPGYGRCYAFHRNINEKILSIYVSFLIFNLAHNIFEESTSRYLST